MDSQWRAGWLELVRSPQDMLDFVLPILKSRVLKLIYFIDKWVKIQNVGDGER